MIKCEIRRDIIIFEQFWKSFKKSSTSTSLLILYTESKRYFYRVSARDFNVRDLVARIA